MTRSKKLFTAFVILTMLFANIAYISPDAAVKRPARVTGVKAVKVATNSVRLSWKKAKRAKGYSLYLKKGKKFKKIKTMKKRSIVIKKLAVNKKYSFLIKAYNTKKNKKRYGKASKIINIKLKSEAPKTPAVTTPENKPSTTTSTNVPQIAKTLNVAPSGMGNVPNDVKNAKMTNKSPEFPLEYHPESNVNEFTFRFSADSDCSGMTFNAYEITPQKVKTFFGEFYEPSSVRIKSITKAVGSRNKNTFFHVTTDPFVSDIYFYATDKNGKVVYGKKLGWNYGETKHDINSPMFAQAKGNNDVFGKMYDKMRKSIEKELWDGHDYNYQKKGGIMNNYLLSLAFQHGCYTIADIGGWMPGLCDPRTGANKRYFTWLGVAGGFDCVEFARDFCDDIAHDIDPNVKTELVRDSDLNQAYPHFYLKAIYSNNEFDNFDSAGGDWEMPYYDKMLGDWQNLSAFRNLIKTDHWQNHITKYCPSWREFVPVD